jgi:hypothetical protein
VTDPENLITCFSSCHIIQCTLLVKILDRGFEFLTVRLGNNPTKNLEIRCRNASKAFLKANNCKTDFGKLSTKSSFKKSSDSSLEQTISRFCIKRARDNQIVICVYKNVHLLNSQLTLCKINRIFWHSYCLGMTVRSKGVL